MERQRLPPGFRFSPTDEELVIHYLKNRACDRDYHQGVIAEVDIYKHEPWDLPEKSALSSPDPVWYFFNVQDKRHPHSARINRTTSKGYWKATGKDRKIFNGPHTVGIKKTLIYYEGRAPSGKRTDWIMHEYKLDEDFERRSKVICSSALCRIRKKGGPGPRNGEQYGAPVLNENSEGGEDVDDDVDEKVPLPSPSGYAAVAPSLPEQVKIPKEEVVLLDAHTEGCASNDLPHVQSAELDLNKFLETLLGDNAEVTSPQVDIPSFTVMDRSQIGQYNSTFGINQDVLTLSDVEQLLGLDGTDVHYGLHPTCNEEQILRELFHLTDERQCLTGMPSQAPTDKDLNLCSNFAASVSQFGDYIEINDMNSPLDGFVVRSPSYYEVEQQLPPDLFDDVEVFGGLPDLLSTQGVASRRMRLQIKPQECATKTYMQPSDAVCSLHSEPPTSGGAMLKVESPYGLQKLVKASSGLGSDSDGIIEVSAPASHVIEHMASYMATNNIVIKDPSSAAKADLVAEESVAFKLSSYIAAARSQPVVSNTVSFSPTLLSTSSCMKEACLDCEAGLGASKSNSGNVTSSENEASADMEAGPGTKVVGDTCKLVGLADDGNQEVGQLVSKVKALTLSNRLVELESNLGNTFNNKVFAYGKTVIPLFPTMNYMNPYRSLRHWAIASSCRIGVAALVLFFLFLAIHLLTKYMLALAA